MPTRCNVRTYGIVFSIVGLVVGLLIHFLVLSSPHYNWINPILEEPAALSQSVTTAAIYLLALV